MWTFLLVVLHQSLQRRLHDVADTLTVESGCFVQFILVVVGDAANKVDGQLFRLVAPWGGEDVALEELLKAVDEKGVDGWMLPMSRTERTE